MNLPGLITVKPEQTQLIEELSSLVGISFMEEYWMREWLTALDVLNTSEMRKLEISRAMLEADFTVGSLYQCVYTLPDKSAVAGGYLASDLEGRTWNELEEEAIELLAQKLTEEERPLLMKKAEQMAPVTNTTWLSEVTAGKDFIHWYALGVDPEKRGSGAFRKLIQPFLEYADEQGLPCLLECYSDKTEGIYGHFGFETVKRLSDPAFPITERCMVRKPHKRTQQ